MARGNNIVGVLLVAFNNVGVQLFRSLFSYQIHVVAGAQTFAQIAFAVGEDQSAGRADNLVVVFD